jgi:predicted transcriptional regulator
MGKQRGIYETDKTIKKAILEFLAEREMSYFGEIIKNLSLSYSKGIKNILEMKKEGLIDNSINPPKYNLVQKD